MKKATDYRRQFCTLQEEVKNAIRDLMTEYNINRLEMDIENRESHEIGYHTIYCEWQSEVIGKINLIADDTLELINQWDEVLQNDGIADSEWVVILEMVEEQIELDYKPRYYPVFNMYNPTKRHCLGYGDIVNIDECESFPTLMDAKREVLRRMMAETNNLVDIPVHTIYERNGNTYKEVSTAIASHHCYLLGIEPPVVTDDLIKQGMTNVYIHTL